jgi:hypothetical protein
MLILTAPTDFCQGTLNYSKNQNNAKEQDTQINN